MSRIYTFDSKIKEVGNFAQFIDNSAIKNETMFFNCDLEFAYKNGNEITRSFIDALPNEWQTDDVVFDSRVHMLMTGWYPCIAGYHHDDVPRTIEMNGQPDYDDMKYKSEHILGIVNADVSPTHFALGKSKFYKVDTISGGNVYKAWHDEVVKQLNDGYLELKKAEDRKLYNFDWQTWHTGSSAVGNGWRWFGRVSRNTDRTKKITNEIRRQAQVYMDNLTDGW